MCQTDVLLIKIKCRHCKTCFLMCRKCYRGHVYCSTACRIKAQKISHRNAQRKYRQTQKGKTAHRENEKKRRMGRIKKTVADASILQRIVRVIKIPYRPKQRARCSYCGAFGKIVDTFPPQWKRSMRWIAKNNGRNYGRSFFKRRALWVAERCSDQHLDWKAGDWTQSLWRLFAVPVPIVLRFSHSHQNRNQSGKMLQLPKKLQHHRSYNDLRKEKLYRQRSIFKANKKWMRRLQKCF